MFSSISKYISVKDTQALRSFPCLALLAVGLSGLHAAAQAPAAPGPQLGTVTAVTASSITLKTDAGKTVTLTVPDTAKVQQLAVGSTDIKTATPSQMSSVAVGDRVLASVKAGDTPDTFTARQVVLMKSGDIAQKNAADQADWRRRGGGGIVSAIDPATGTITVESAGKKIVISTDAKTVFRRYSSDSVAFKDATPSTLAQLHAGDQVQARGTKSADGATIQAEEVIGGSFKNLSGLVTSIDPAASTITLKDLATKKTMTVHVTANSDLHNMPLQQATMFAARANGGAAAGGRGARGGAAPAGGDNAGGGAPPSEAPQGGGGPPAGGRGGAPRSAGADLAQMIPRLPKATLADLKPGAAVMIVASEPTPGATTVTAVTLLSGVEPILTANPTGGMSLSMSIGGGAGAE
jgi:co-chaperonin GroES (HSP10)